MGLLDDAIREHLELKRKHGADPDDLARQEQEALGPGQRNEFAQPPEAAEAPLEEQGAAEDPAPVDELPEAESAVDEADEEPGYEEDPWLADDTGQAPEPAQGEEDVLEETPDFLQETPEHDRLWFEQKPPRDFDWDK
jgi:hypothetical protein